jgi:hypothetical protein
LKDYIQNWQSVTKEILSLFLCFALSACASTQKKYTESFALDESDKKTIPKRLYLPTDLASRVKVWRRIVSENIETSGSAMYGASDCTAFTQIWLEKINSKYDVKLIYSSSSGVGDIALNNGSTAKQDITHVFVTDRGLCPNSDQCKDEIIIDASYLQFVEQGACLVMPQNETLGTDCKGSQSLKNLPKVLVGSQADISEFYSHLPTKVQIQLNGVNQNTGNWLPKSAASLIYSFGVHFPLRTNLAIFEGSEKK